MARRICSSGDTSARPGEGATGEGAPGVNAAGLDAAVGETATA
jgi:hypothetical protein